MSSPSQEPLRRVLIASANPLFARGLQKMVTQRWAGRNVEIRMAGSMEEAAAALEDWQPDLVIVDYDDVDRPGTIQRGAFLSHFISGERPMQVMLVSLRESGEVVVYDRRTLTPAEAEDWFDLPWAPAEAQPAAAEARAEAAPAAPELQQTQRSGGMKHYVIVGVLTVIVTLLVRAALFAIDLTPAPSSAQAGPIDAMINLQAWLISFIFSLITVFIVYSMFAFRGRDDKEYGAYFKSSTRLEVVWTIIPLGLVLALSFLGARDLAEIGRVDPQALEVKVTAFQWGWLYEYPEWGIQSNTLYLPVNRQVRLSMTSRDVIHSFWVPEFRVKQDILPGEKLVKELRITPTEIGEYQVMCAEMCGGAHALMVSPVAVVSQADFDAWVSEQSGAAAGGQPPEARGRQLAETQGCLSCHSIDGSTVVGPTWQGLYGAEVTLAGGGTDVVDDEYLHTAIVDPGAQVREGFPPGVMQSYRDMLTDEQIADIIAFIRTLQ